MLQQSNHSASFVILQTVLYTRPSALKGISSALALVNMGFGDFVDKVMTTSYKVKLKQHENNDGRNV